MKFKKYIIFMMVIKILIYVVSTVFWVSITENIREQNNKEIYEIILKENEEYMRNLHTSMKDIKGNLPYLRELKDVKESGEVIQSYYFKNKSSNKIEKKLSYAKLYKPYNWIIATGMPMTDITDRAAKISALTQNSIEKMLSFSILITIVHFIFDVLIIYVVQKNFHIRAESFIKKETELDVLTEAYSRKTGIKVLMKDFEKFKRNNINSLVMFLDIDDYKYINDSFGHDMGDKVLQMLVQTLRYNMRKEDFICRWGGDEFVLIFAESDIIQQEKLVNKLLECVRGLEIYDNGKKVPISISMGCSMFYREDEDYLQSLSRADKALYCSKQQGKNKYTFYHNIDFI